MSHISTDTQAVIKEATEAAVKGAEATKTMKAQAGRASYVAADKVVANIKFMRISNYFHFEGHQ